MENIEQLEGRLWESADQLRANSKLTSTEYCMPVLGLIFLRHAYNRFLVVQEEILKALPVRGGVQRPVRKEDFAKKSALYLPENARYDFLLNLPSDKDKGKAIIDAMEAIERDYDGLSGVLPKDYRIFENDLMTRLLKIFNDEALQKASGDVFGRIYEYFLMNFAMQGAQDSGEFFTPVSIVQTIVNVIEPDHGTVLDPACGSGGMFVQTSHFLEAAGRAPQDAVTFYGQEKTATTIRLAKMNLGVHGLEGKIAEGNTFYEDRHELFGKADFVMANPPFNVDSVDAEKIKNDPRLPFGLPGVNQKGEVSNGNYLWISYFYSYLNPKGRTGFVMSSQASSAGHGEKEVRKKIIQAGHVDVMIAIRSNFFYTRAVPCELWFFDKGKPKEKRGKILMLDARNIFRKVTRKIYDFSPEQLKNVTAIIWLYRGDKKRFLDLVTEYFRSLSLECASALVKLDGFEKGISALQEAGESFVRVLSNGNGKRSDSLAKIKESQDVFLKYLEVYEAARAMFLKERDKFQKRIYQLPATIEAQLKERKSFDALAEQAKNLIKEIDHIAKLGAKAADVALETPITQGEFQKVDGRPLLKAKKELDPLRKDAAEQLKKTLYYYKQIAWLLDRFPQAEFRNVEGLVKLVDIKEIETNDWSLSPGRYVGVAPQEEDENFDFEETIKNIHIELASLNEEATELGQKIQESFEELEV